MKYWLRTGLLVALFAIAGSMKGWAQVDTSNYHRVNGRLIVQLSGVVVEQSTQIPLMGVHVYSPRYGRGTSTDIHGFFSEVFLEGDSVLVSAIGFKKQWVVVKANKGDKLTVVIELEEDTTYLSEVEILPYPTERQLRESILAFSDPNVQQQMALARSMDPELYERMRLQLPQSANENYRYYQDQQFYNQHNNGVRGIPLLNPFAWGELIKSIKRGDFDRD